MATENKIIAQVLDFSLGSKLQLKYEAKAAKAAEQRRTWLFVIANSLAEVLTEEMTAYGAKTEFKIQDMLSSMSIRDYFSNEELVEGLKLHSRQYGISIRTSIDGGSVIAEWKPQ